MNFFLISLVFMGLVLLGTFFVSFYKFLGEREMSSPFECGFDTKNSSRSPFSLRFFLILMLFLIFDIEMILILQFPLFLSFFKSLSLVGLLFFLLFLFIATVEEWRRGFLNWVYE